MRHSKGSYLRRDRGSVARRRVEQPPITLTFSVFAVPGTKSKLWRIVNELGAHVLDVKGSRDKAEMRARALENANARK